MLKSVIGVVANTTDYQESSKILNVITKDGIIGIMAKGAKNIKSPIRLVADKLTYAEFIIYYKEDKLSTLKEGVIIDNLYNIKTNLENISYYTYITELVMQVMKQNNSEEVFNNYIDTILKINEGMNPKVMMNILEVKLLDYLGVGLELNKCAKCGSTKNIVTVGMGGYICQNCHTFEALLDPLTRKMLRMYYLVEISSIKELDIKESTIERINVFLSEYYDLYTGLYIHSKRFLEKTTI